AMLSLADAQSVADDFKGAQETTRLARERAAAGDARLQYSVLKREAENALRARDFALALQLKKETLATAQRLYGDEHVESLEARLGIAEMYADTGDFAQSEAVARECLALYDRIYGKPTDFLLDVLSALGSVQNYQNHMDDAQATFERAAELVRT